MNTEAQDTAYLNELAEAKRNAALTLIDAITDSRYQAMPHNGYVSCVIHDGTPLLYAVSTITIAAGDNDDMVRDAFFYATVEKFGDNNRDTRIIFTNTFWPA